MFAENASPEGGNRMKSHQRWAIATVICMIMTMYTGYKRK